MSAEINPKNLKDRSQFTEEIKIVKLTQVGRVKISTKYFAPNYTTKAWRDKYWTLIEFTGDEPVPAFGDSFGAEDQALAYHQRNEDHFRKLETEYFREKIEAAEVNLQNDRKILKELVTAPMQMDSVSIQEVFLENMAADMVDSWDMDTLTDFAVQSLAENMNNSDPSDTLAEFNKFYDIEEDS